MKVLVTGGRKYNDSDSLRRALDHLHAQTPFTLLIHGGASGADRLAAAWAASAGVPIREFPADWNRYGNSAGPRRNREMLAFGPDLVVAFPGGTGTQDMVGIATAAGVRVVFAGNGSLGAES